MFTTDMVLQVDPLPDYWWFYQPLVWEDAVYGVITVPVGLRTDLASIPRFLRNIPALDPNGISRLPAGVHDWLYAWQGWPKDRVDEFLRDACLAQGATQTVADWFYDAVHDFGQSAWDANTREWFTTDFDTAEHYMAWKASASDI